MSKCEMILPRSLAEHRKEPHISSGMDYLTYRTSCPGLRISLGGNKIVLRPLLHEHIFIKIEMLEDQS